MPTLYEDQDARISILANDLASKGRIRFRRLLRTSDPQAGRRALRLQIDRVDHDRLRRGARGRQSFHYAEEDTPLAPSLPPIVESCVGHTPEGHRTIS
jgi:hypothetical protein